MIWSHMINVSKVILISIRLPTKPLFYIIRKLSSDMQKNTSTNSWGVRCKPLKISNSSNAMSMFSNSLHLLINKGTSQVWKTFNFIIWWVWYSQWQVFGLSQALSSFNNTESSPNWAKLLLFFVSGKGDNFTILAILLKAPFDVNKMGIKPPIWRKITFY